MNITIHQNKQGVCPGFVNDFLEPTGTLLVRADTGDITVDMHTKHLPIYFYF